ncbi:putative fatty acyl-CoA reductase CG5065 [Phlebotomus argentipes]|uniref:putative fatty acyl-CoA reductase CG5065 n=1 Tax=Phlebotomus argentipes TaxID=94469 RepID=UPI002892BAC7|nr:putative fatty acyl-CoA reductase CG5065 [Phlebotomus argentipes]
MDYSAFESFDVRISEFFRDREVFLTGGTGTVGKALIEKLFYSCPHVGKIFMLIRPKKGISIHERLAKFTSDPIFKRIREKDENLLKKLVAINGDCKELNLGLSDDDKELMGNVSVVFHAAASIRFDDPLQDAILLNTRGTREVLEFAKNLKKLCVFVHISTTYCIRPDLFDVEEKLYPMKADWKESIRIAENVDKEEMEIVAPFYMDFFPNSYTFTKGLAEQLIESYKDKLPVVIFRPSIVTPSLREPFPGWHDFINGPIAYTLPGSLGITHVAIGRKSTLCDYTPLDIVVRSLIVTSYVHGMKYERHKRLPKVEVYNCAAGLEMAMSIRDLMKYAMGVLAVWPVDQAIWVSRAILTDSIILFKVLTILMHFLPVLMLDFLAMILRRKRRLLPVMRTIAYATCKLQFYLCNTWNFNNSKCFSLAKYVTKEDQEEFLFDYYPEYPPERYLFLCAIGNRRYLLKQSDDNLPYARRRFRLIQIGDYIFLALFYASLYKFFIHEYVSEFYGNLCNLYK